MMAVMSLRVMTWNLWWHFGPWERRRALVIETIRSVEPDVVCLQEVWSDEHHDDAAVLADDLGMHVTRTDHVFWNGQSFGNAVLSRWPLERIADERLPNAAGEPGHRRIVAARIDTPYGPWPVASTHLDHRFDQSDVRQAQVVTVMDLAARWRGDPEVDLPVVVGADLNAVPDTDEVRTLTGRRPGVPGIVFSDAWEQAGDGSRGATWLRANPYSRDTAWPERRLDYVLVSWPRPKPTGNPERCWLVGRGADDEAVWPSDHLAVVADLTTRDTDRAPGG